MPQVRGGGPQAKSATWQLISICVGHLGADRLVFAVLNVVE